MLMALWFLYQLLYNHTVSILIGERRNRKSNRVSLFFDSEVAAYGVAVYWNLSPNVICDTYFQALQLLRSYGIYVCARCVAMNVRYIENNSSVFLEMLNWHCNFSTGCNQAYWTWIVYQCSFWKAWNLSKMWVMYLGISYTNEEVPVYCYPNAATSLLFNSDITPVRVAG